MFSAERASPPARAGDQRAPARPGRPRRRTAAPRCDDDGDLLVGQRLERVELHPRHQRRVDLEVRVLGRRPDQRHEPLLDRRQERVLLRLVEAVDLVEEEDRALPVRAEALAGACRARRAPRRPWPRLPTAPRTRRRCARRRSAPAWSCRSRAARRRPSSRRGPARSRAGAPSARRARAAGRRTRRASPAARAARAAPRPDMRSCAASANRSPIAAKYAQHVSRREQTGLEDELGPILPGAGASDYERYIRTDELLALQKTEAERAHHDELLFQITHQSSELWLKLASTEIGHGHGARWARATSGRRSGSSRRAVLCLKLITEQLDMLELMSPWEYTSGVRPELGHGSGFDSPGWNALRRSIPAAGEAFQALRRAAGLSMADVYRQRARARGSGRARGDADRARRAGGRLAHPPPARRRAHHRRRGRRHAGNARRAARRARPPQVLPRALGRAQRADRAGEAGGGGVSFEQLKERQRLAWGAAPFEKIEDSIAAMHDDLVAQARAAAGRAVAGRRLRDRAPWRCGRPGPAQT